VTVRRALVTGASRGLGAALCAELTGRGWAVQAATRAGPGLRLDYNDPTSIAAAGEACAAAFDRLDLLVNCGAVNSAPGHRPAASKGPLASLEAVALTALWQTNVVGPVLAVRALLPLLRRSARGVVANISTSRASLSLATDPGSFGYAVSKAALNMATRKLAAELAPEGIDVFAIDPGWLRTAMGGPEAPVGPEQAATDLVHLLTGDTRVLSGQFVDRWGIQVPW
jgi:NAD(P)-dependent dehydrogenase (short-subunit alcohol dehydrogenase family)